MYKIIIFLFLSITTFADSFSFQKEYFSYTNNIPSENNIRLTEATKINDQTIVFNYLNSHKYGFNDNQYGIDLYSKLGEKDDKMYGYISFLISPEHNFLAKDVYSATIYKGFNFNNTEINLAIKRMEFYTDNVSLLTFGFNTDIIDPKFILKEDVTYLPKNQKASFFTSFSYNNWNTFKLSYAYEFGNSIENLGFQGLKNVNHSQHIIDFNYKFSEHIIGDLMFNHTNYETLYIQHGMITSLSYIW
jgi:hypothetical protein